MTKRKRTKGQAIICSNPVVYFLPKTLKVFGVAGTGSPEMLQIKYLRC